MKTVKWGVLGTADIARRCTIPGMQQAENCCLYAIAGRSAEKAEQFRTSFGFEKAYDSYEALLADPEVEAVYIPLPNELHYEWALKAIEANKHVLCEKPLAPTPDQIDALFDAAEAHGVVLMEAFAYLHSPFMAALKQELQHGSIGDPLYLESVFITSDYDQSNIRMRKETFGGSTYDLGCYNTSQILWLLDEEPEDIKAVAEFAPNGIDVCTTGILQFSGGKRAVFQCGMVLATEQGRRIDRVSIHGTRGNICSDVEFNQDGVLTYTVSVDGVRTVKSVDTPQNYKLEVEQLGRCITDGVQPFVSRAFTVRNARVLDRILHIIGYYD